MKDKQRYLVIVQGFEGFIPVEEYFKVIGKRKALKLKRKLQKKKNYISHKKVFIKKDTIAKEIEYMPFGLFERNK